MWVEVTWDGVHLFENRKTFTVCLHWHILAHLGESTTDRMMVRQRAGGQKCVTEGHTNQQTDKPAEGRIGRGQSGLVWKNCE